MHIINFFIALMLAFLPFVDWLYPLHYMVPEYFQNQLARNLIVQFSALNFFWLGLLRYYVIHSHTLSERGYWFIVFVLVIFSTASKIIMGFPLMWFNAITSLVLGWFSISNNQKPSKLILFIMGVISIAWLYFISYILVRMSWYGDGYVEFYNYRSYITNL